MTGVEAESQLTGVLPIANKKRRFVPPATVASNLATALDLHVLHQKINLSAVLVRFPAKEPQWHFHGTTVLYVVDEASQPCQNIALHLRRSCRIISVEVETLARIIPQGETHSQSTVALITLPIHYQHGDPLAHVLVKSPSSYTEDDIVHLHKDADAQCSRGSSGMTTGMRVASVASSMGELRITISDPNKPKIRIGQPKAEHLPTIIMDVTKEEAQTAWYNDLVEPAPGSAVRKLQANLWKRSALMRESRMKRVSNELTDATARTEQSNTIRAMKITVKYHIPVNNSNAHYGGIHFHTEETPHIYTTTGVVGDHEGSRCWLPCLDSANSRHRASRELTIQVTAPIREGLLAVGFGEDFGVHKAYLHDQYITKAASSVLGSNHVSLVNSIYEEKTESNVLQTEQGSVPHVIPFDDASNTIDAVLVTSMFCSYNWTPCPARSLGFAIGPFRILDDPEYFSADENEGATQDELQNEYEMIQALDAARINGEGIRQVYFAPLYERKYIHCKANLVLLPNTNITIAPCNRKQQEITEKFDQTIVASTIGVPHRALSLVRDILALPASRTASYTQIWIPNAVHGGSSSGALHCCPDVLVNPFLGGAIMDSRLLPPIDHRLPFYAGGRVLQFLQARCAIRGWITAALPLGGRDDVGFGYIFSLIESFLMSLYERGHGASGEGGAKGGVFYNKRYALTSGLNSSNLEFLPVNNIEETELDPLVAEMLGAVPIGK